MEFVVCLLLMVWGIAGLNFALKFLKAKKQTSNPLWKDLMLIKMRLQLMNPREFEMFCGELLMLQGYDAVVTKATQDEGRDIIIYHQDKSETFVECKLYNAELNSIISRPIAQKLIGAIRHEEVMNDIKVKGIIMTTSRFTEEAKEYCLDMEIKMIDTDEILNIVQTLDIEKVLYAVGVSPIGLTGNSEEENELVMEQEV